jgi:hypothetical protein
MFNLEESIDFQAIYRNMPNLVQTVAPSSHELIQLISDPPSGSKNLIILVGISSI